MSLYSTFGTDKEKEVSGVSVEVPEAADENGVVPEFILCRMGKSNRNYTKAVEMATKPYRRGNDIGHIPNEKAEQIFIEVFCKSILIGWKNVKDRKGAVMPFSVENAIKLMTDLPDLYDMLQEKAKALSTFREEQLEEEAKN